MTNYIIKDLEHWHDKILKIADELKLDPYPIEYEICDYEDMMQYITYSGMPTHYPHWSYGKMYERTKTLYDYGLTNLPYELITNFNPSIAYLMTDNSLILQVLIMAHCLNHSHFFKNNIYFKTTRAEYALEKFKDNSERVRDYQEKIGIEKVEAILDAARALAYNRSRAILIKDKKKETETKIEKNPFWEIRPREKESEEVIIPEENILGYIIEHGKLEDWEKDLINIVRSETSYFFPQIMTKTVNEGLATYGHYTILNKLDLPIEMQLEFLVHHNRVVAPIVGGLNPYHVGFKILKDVEKRFGHEKILDIVETESDTSLIRRYLTKDLARELFLFRHERKDSEFRKVTTTSDSDESFKEIRDTLISNLGLNTIPVIKIVKCLNKDELPLKHYFDNRQLNLEHTERTLEHIYTLWKSKVSLDTIIMNKHVRIIYDGQKVEIEEIS